MSINDGGPAFPIWTEDMPVEGASGLSIRDYFAAKAMQGMCAGFPPAELWAEIPPETIAEEAYEMADAMLAARGNHG